MDIGDLVRAIDEGRIRITRHARVEAAADRLSFEEIWESVRREQIIEEYPSDSPYPSCLVFGVTRNGMPIHSVWAYNEVNGWAVLVTAYRPDPERWTDWVQRKNRT